MKKQISKKTNEAFGKKIYLLGRDENGTNYWLEHASWDCDWYWGFGYVETYTNNNNPNKSSDIKSHSHIETSFMGKMQKYDSDKQCFVDSNYVYNIFDAPLLSETTFSKEEGWKLSELFQCFYRLKDSAEILHRGNSNYTWDNPCIDLIKKEDWAKEINNNMLPAIFEEIYKILSPNK